MVITKNDDNNDNNDNNRKAAASLLVLSFLHIGSDSAACECAFACAAVCPEACYASLLALFQQILPFH